MIIIGLTGQTGSGKSLAAKILKDHGAYIIDADKIAHDALLPGGGAYNEVIENLGEKILNSDKLIDRKKVADIVFKDPKQLKIHTETTHKHILLKIHDELKHAKACKCKLVCIDAPLLAESGLHTSCDFVWVIYADYDKMISRIIERDNISINDAKSRIKSQTPFDKTAAFADVLLENNASEEEFKQMVLLRMTECTKK